MLALALADALARCLPARARACIWPAGRSRDMARARARLAHRAAAVPARAAATGPPAAARGAPGAAPARAQADLARHCFYAQPAGGWWRVEVCPGARVRQYHASPAGAVQAVVELGAYDAQARAPGVRAIAWHAAGARRSRAAPVCPRGCAAATAPAWPVSSVWVASNSCAGQEPWLRCFRRAWWRGSGGAWGMFVSSLGPALARHFVAG
jgi:hypothetical protein